MAPTTTTIKPIVQMMATFAIDPMMSKITPVQPRPCRG